MRQLFDRDEGVAGEGFEGDDDGGTRKQVGGKGFGFDKDEGASGEGFAGDEGTGGEGFEGDDGVPLAPLHPSDGNYGGERCVEPMGEREPM